MSVFKNKKIFNILYVALILFMVFLPFAGTLNAQEVIIFSEPVLVSINTDTNYKLLAPLPDGKGGLIENFESDPDKNPCAFGKYMNSMIKIVIGVAAVLAMIMIIKGGFEYMASSLPSGKESGKSTITQAILGLLIALGAYLILYTINPNLLDFCLDQQIPKTSITIDDSIPQTPIDGKYCTNTHGGPYFDGQDWVIIGEPVSLPNGVESNHLNRDCETVGEQNCTSLRKLNLSTINKIKTSCVDCGTITITGGTECWLHGGSKQSTTHYHGSSTIDLRFEANLDAYIKSGTQKEGSSRYEKDGIFYLKEPNHWHVGL